jgi:hypothetical protein
MKVPIWIQVGSTWILILMLTFAVGALCQWLFFGDRNVTDFGFLLRWPILWCLYFFVSIGLFEHIVRFVLRLRGPH